MGINISDKKLKNIIKESVKEVLESEIMKLRAFAVPEISEKEQKEIEKTHNLPSSKRKYNTLSIEV